jgi:hypothetical protein
VLVAGHVGQQRRSIGHLVSGSARVKPVFRIDPQRYGQSEKPAIRAIDNEQRRHPNDHVTQLEDRVGLGYPLAPRPESRRRQRVPSCLCPSRIEAARRQTPVGSKAPSQAGPRSGRSRPAMTTRQSSATVRPDLNDSVARSPAGSTRGVDRARPAGSSSGQRWIPVSSTAMTPESGSTSLGRAVANGPVVGTLGAARD